MKDNRISSFKKINQLHAFPAQIPASYTQSGQHEDFLFLVTKPEKESVTINFKDLKSSIVNDTVSLTGDQLIRGKKVFEDDCQFNGKLLAKEIIDTTQEGDISGYNFLGENIFFDKIGVGDRFSSAQETLQRALNIDGGIYAEGNLISEGSGIFSGDLSSENLKAHNNITIEEDLHCSGNLFCGGDMEVKGDLFLSGSLRSTQNESFIEISKDHLKLAFDDENYVDISSGIDVVISGENKFSINSGALNISGDAFFQELYVTGEDGSFEKVVPQKYDEAVFFSKKLPAGLNRYDIEFPKTFGSIPSVQATLLSAVADPYINHYISSITESSMEIKFEQNITGTGYFMQVSATPSQVLSVHQTKLQSFSTGLLAGGLISNEVYFPEAFDRPPVINLTLEAKETFKTINAGGIGDEFFEEPFYYIFTTSNEWRRVEAVIEQRESGSIGQKEIENDFLYICTGEDFWAKISVSGSNFYFEDDFDFDGYHLSGEYLYKTNQEGDWKEVKLSSWPYEDSHSDMKYTLSNISQEKFTINFDSLPASNYNIHIMAAR